MKTNKFIGFNILITAISFLFIVIGVVGMFSYSPSQFKETKVLTGVIEEYKQRDGKWYDVISGGTTKSYFNIRLSNDSFYEATGINYDNINRELYDVINIGDEITIRYVDNGWSAPNDIVSIEYKGITYLEFNAILKEFERNDKIMKIVGISIISVTTLCSIMFYIINYRKNKKYLNKAGVIHSETKV